MNSPYPKIAYLDGLRGMAFLYVLISHISNARGLIFAGIGQTGVWLFFCLSAYLLSVYFFKAPEHIGQKAEWLNYFFRRSLRIIPIFALAIFAEMMFSYYAPEKALAIFLLLDPESIYWALYVECRFYLVLPLLIMVIILLSAERRLIKMLALVCAIESYMLLYLAYPMPYTILYMDKAPETNLAAFYLLPLFLGGICVAWFYARHHIPALPVPGVLLWLLLLTPLLASAGMLNALSGSALPPDYYYPYWLVGGIFFACFLMLLLHANPTSLHHFLSSRVMRFIGNISYPGYLTHMLLIKLLSPLIPSTALFCVVLLIATFAIATILHIAIERPLSRYFIDRQYRIIRK